MPVPTFTAEICFTAGLRDVEAGDDFDRANSATTLGVAQGIATESPTTANLQPWEPLNGTWGISADAAYLAAAGPGTYQAAVVPCMSNGVFQYRNAVSQNNTGLVFRVVDLANFWRVVRAGTVSTWRLIKTVAGVETTYTPGTLTIADGTLVAVHAAGDTISLYVDGVLGYTVPDPDVDLDVPWANRAGLYAQGTGAGRWNKFSARYEWTNVTADVRRATPPSSHRGAQYELNRIEPGGALLTLDNLTGAYTPSNTAGVHYPFVLPYRRLRLRATWQAATYDVFSGFIERWPVSWPVQGNDDLITVEAVDGLAIFGTRNYLSKYAAAVLTYGPRAYWRMIDSVSQPADYGPGDYSATSGTGTFFDVLGNIIVAEAETTGVTYSSPSADGCDMPAAGGISSSGSFSLVLWYFTNGATSMCLASQAATVGSTTGGWRIYSNGGTPNKLAFDVGPDSALGSVTMNNGAIHMVCLVRDVAAGTIATYFDGSATPDATVSPGAVEALTSNYLSVGRDKVGAAANFGGTIGEVAVYDYALSASAMAALYAAGSATLQVNAAASGTQMGNILDLARWPASIRDIDAGDSTEVGVIVAQTNTILGLCEQVATDEDGLLFIDAAGNAVFRSRTGMYDTPPTVTVGDGAAEIAYRDPVISYDITRVANQITVTDTAAAPHVETDHPSQRAYELRPLAKTTNLAAPDAATFAAFLRGRYKNPHLRVERVTVVPQRDAGTTWWTTILGLDVGNMITFTRRPPAGDTISLDCLIAEVAHNAIGLPDWTVTFDLTPVEGVARLGALTLGVDHLAF